MVDAAGVQILATVPYARPGAPPVADLLAAMSAASSRRVECGLLLGGVPDPADAARLVQLPFAVRRMDSDRSTSGHAKGLVADRAVLVSSANWSSTGLGGNWEAALRIDDPAAAAYYAAAWRRDWDSARPIEV